MAVLLAASPAMAADDDWPTYHRTADHAGVAAPGSTFSDVQQTWSTAPLDAAVYASPLYVGGHILVATENNTIYSLDVSSGSTTWQTHLGDPALASSLPCGNIRPTVGITSTPTVDTNAGVLYAVGMFQPSHYELYGVDISSGAVVFHRALDETIVDAPSEGQRGALALEQGRVYVPFGGRLGDCGDYHGQVIAASVSDPNAPLLTYTTPAPRTGIWAASGVGVAADGTLFVATGNGEANSADGRTEAVLALSPDLKELDSWQADDWQALDRSDIDIGSVSPAILQDMGLIFQSGKNGKGYVLRMGSLGGVGGELASGTLPGNCKGVYGGTAYSRPLLYIPCGTHVEALAISSDPPGFSLAWSGPDGTGVRAVGSPILAAGAVWHVDFKEQRGRLFALDAATGATRFVGELSGQPYTFATPAYGGGQVYVATSDGVAAFQLIGLSSP